MSVIIKDMANDLLDIFIAQKTAQGWEVVNRTDTSVQMRKPKQWNQAAIIIGLLTSILGFGFFILLLAALDYVFKRDRIAFVTIDQLKAGKLSKEFEERNRTGQIIAIILVSGLVLAFLLYWGFTTFGL